MILTALKLYCLVVEDNCIYEKKDIKDMLVALALDLILILGIVLGSLALSGVGCFSGMGMSAKIFGAVVLTFGISLHVGFTFGLIYRGCCSY